MNLQLLASAVQEMGPLEAGPDLLSNYLAVSAVLFGAGLFAMITRRNAIGILMGTELILNAANINFVAFARFRPAGLGFQVDGQLFALFVIVLAAAEAAVALALVLALFQSRQSIDLEEATELKG